MLYGNTDRCVPGDYKALREYTEKITSWQLQNFLENCLIAWRLFKRIFLSVVRNINFFLLCCNHHIFNGLEKIILKTIRHHLLSYVWVFFSFFSIEYFPYSSIRFYFFFIFKEICCYLVLKLMANNCCFISIWYGYDRKFNSKYL